ncbi:hypothetical protein RhiirA4_458964 [Rhizophagus irregularis]|uniref:Uncharacterized protein n=1 Tax=Rhizophagus irregularis TaxID=588596 RepID=A0A2I1GDC4_9GLOM|nr:hypothetical protein RhiirA4_458964 [Rhizophagus irregularis]
MEFITNNIKRLSENIPDEVDDEARNLNKKIKLILEKINDNEDVRKLKDITNKVWKERSQTKKENKYMIKENIYPFPQTKLNVQAQPYTPRGKKRVTYADIVIGSGSDDSWPTSPSPEEKQNTQLTSKKGSTNNKSQQQTTKKSKLTLEKMISTVMTRYMPEDKANVREIVIYDIPSTMPQLDILTNLGK